MTLPMSLDHITVTGQFRKYSGAPQIGTVRFTNSQLLQSGEEDLFITPGFKEVALDEDGKFSIDLPATDDPDWIPQGYAYQVDINLEGWKKMYTLKIPWTAPGGTLDLADVLPNNDTNSPASYVPLNSVGKVGGPAGPLDSEGLIPPNQLPAGTGGDEVVVSWDEITDVPATFPPSAHAASHGSGGTDALTLALSQITGLVSALSDLAQADVGLGDSIGDINLAMGNILDDLAEKVEVVQTFTGTPTGGTHQRINLNYTSMAINRPDLLQVWVDGVLSFWKNEFGGARGTPPMPSFPDDALLRAIQSIHLTAGNTGGYVELQNAARDTILHKRDWHGRLWRGDGSGVALLMSDVLVLGAGDPVPSQTPPNTVIMRLP